MDASRGFGLAGETARESILAAATGAERSGYHSFWLSQPPEGSTLEVLQEVSGITASILLGVGAIPLTSRTAEDISREVSDLGLPRDRLRLGIGSGTGIGSLDRLRTGIVRLRSLLDVEIVIAPLGPQMCALAGELADTVLLNWLTPAHAKTSASWIRAGADNARREAPSIASYVRCAISDDALPRLAAECARYGSFPHYAAHFRRQGVYPIETTIRARDEKELQEGLARYDDILDHVVVRAITPNDAPSEILALLEAASPRRRHSPAHRSGTT